MYQSRRSSGLLLTAAGMFLLITGVAEIWSYLTTGQVEWRYRGMIWLQGSEALVPYALYVLAGAAIGGKGLLMARRG